MGEKNKEVSTTHNVQSADVSLRIYGYEMNEDTKDALKTTMGYTYRLYVKNLKNTNITNVNVNVISKSFNTLSIFDINVGYIIFLIM